MKTECIIYCRVSSEGQALRDGLRRQFVVCQGYAERKGYSVVAVFSEVASGVDDLPIRQTVERIASKRRCKIICEDYDRWSRKGAVDAPPASVEMATCIAHERENALRAIFSFPTV